MIMIKIITNLYIIFMPSIAFWIGIYLGTKTKK